MAGNRPGYSERQRQRYFPKRTVRIDILPLIDVMFLLVAFFMLISISMVTQRGIFVDLSPASSGKIADREQEAVISVSASGALYFQKQPVTEAELLKQLRQFTRREKEPVVLLNSDRSARYESVVSALDVIRRAGIGKIVFAVEPKE